MENIAAAIYCRLSQDDGNAGESNSIQTQKALLKQYCAENRIPIAGVYCDDGNKLRKTPVQTDDGGH